MYAVRLKVWCFITYNIDFTFFWQNRFYLAGVKMDYLNLSTCIIKPRPGENEIGLKAYKAKPENYLKKYEFK